MKGWFHSSALQSPLGLELSRLSLASSYDAIRERERIKERGAKEMYQLP